jgi:hypothetical protein
LYEISMESCDFQIHKLLERDWGGGVRAAAILTISLMGALWSPGSLISSFPRETVPGS